MGHIREAAHQDNVSDIERAEVLAGLGQILEELRVAEARAGARVMTSPHHAAAARLQSLIASGEGATLQLTPLASGGLEAKFDTGDWLGWAQVAWEKLKTGPAHPLLRPKSALAEPFADEGRVGLLGDWGTGLYGAPKIAEAIRNDRQGFALLLHLGDVYYSGTQQEIQERFIDFWPRRSDAKNRALNSNHEMYSGGHAYFSSTLANFGQEASYFAFQNKSWTLIGLDVAYRDHDIDDQQVAWLKQVIAGAGDRRVILFSHHQLYSHFESQGKKLWAHPGFGEVLRSKRIYAWYWGHEHRCTLFESPDPTFGLWGRCIGHSGMPQSRDPTRQLPKAKGRHFERADWRRSVPQVRDGNALPSAVVLEGRNEDILGEEDKFTPHGYAVLTFDGPKLREQILNASGEVIYDKILTG